MAELTQTAHALGLRVHVDGARIFNAAAALECSVADLMQGADSVQFCLSKGLGAPVGSLLLGSRDYIVEARRVRKMVGGGMRQAGVLAAAGHVALDEIPQRLPQDHANARLLAELLSDTPGLTVDPDAVATNLVFFDIGPELGLPTEFESRLGRGRCGGSSASMRPGAAARLLITRFPQTTSSGRPKSFTTAPSTQAADMRILVTGATGNLGPFVIQALRHDGHDVRALVRESSDRAWLNANRVESIEGDILQPDSLGAAVDGMAAVVHLAGLHDSWAPRAQDFFDLNVDGACNVRDAAQAAGVHRLVFVSSGSTIGEEEDEVGTEDTERRDYALSDYETFQGRGRGRSAGGRVAA